MSSARRGSPPGRWVRAGVTLRPTKKGAPPACTQLGFRSQETAKRPSGTRSDTSSRRAAAGTHPAALFLCSRRSRLILHQFGCSGPLASKYSWILNEFSPLKTTNNIARWTALCSQTEGWGASGTPRPPPAATAVLRGLAGARSTGHWRASAPRRREPTFETNRCVQQACASSAPDAARAQDWGDSSVSHTARPSLPGWWPRPALTAPPGAAGHGLPGQTSLCTLGN